jgi:hypothetical protein
MPGCRRPDRAARNGGVSITFALLMLTPPALGVVGGYLSGGRLAGFRALEVRHRWLIWAAAIVQFGQYALRLWRGPLLALVFALVLAWLGLNLPRWPAAIRVAGLVVVGGSGLNALAIGLNGRMPYRVEAAVSAGLDPGVITPKNVPAGRGTHLPAIGDTIGIPFLHAVASVGDVLIAVGAAALIILAMRRIRLPIEEVAPA